VDFFLTKRRGDAMHPLISLRGLSFDAVLHK